MFEILHFRGSEEILKEKNLLSDVSVTFLRLRNKCGNVL